MRLIYDKAADAAFLYLRDATEPADVKRTDCCDSEMENASVFLLFDADDRLLGFELLGVAKLLPPDALAAAENA